MKGKLIKGKGFRGVLDYVLGKGEHAEIVGGNMSGQDPRTLSAEFALSRELKPEAATPVIHMPLSVTPGEHLTDDQWQQAAHVVMRSMGMDPDNYQHVLVKHTDREHEHVHVVASRVGMNGKLWAQSHEVLKMIAGTQAAEEALHLVRTKGLKNGPEKRKAEKRNRQDAPTVAALQKALDQARADTPDFATFITRLQAVGVTALPAMSADGGRLNGMSWQSEGVTLKGSALGSKYGWGQLSKTIGFDLDRDRPALLALRAGVQLPPAPVTTPTPTLATASVPVRKPSAALARVLASGTGQRTRPAALPPVARAAGERASWENVRDEADAARVKALQDLLDESTAKDEKLKSESASQFAKQIKAGFDAIVEDLSTPPPPQPSSRRPGGPR